MKRLAALALVVLSCAPAKAQFGGMGGRPAAQAQNIEIELLEMEQDADKAALKEALLFYAKQGLKPVSDTRADKEQHVEETTRLRDFIAKKKEAITARATEMQNKRMAGRTVMAPTAETQAERSAKRQAAIEQIETSKVEVQLLEAQVGMLQNPLSKAVQDLAEAELAASKDEERRAKAEEARKDYDRIKARYVELSKRLQMEQEVVQSLQQSLVNGGMGGGFR